jgi:hypothetical protein
MKRIISPAALGLIAARHFVWYVSYQVSGEARLRH